jgi:uncharacterized membrane protein
MKRYTFLDVLRGISVLWMIETHVVNVFLLPELRQTWWFHLLNLSNGFVAPTFIFCAGSGLWIATDRKGAAYKRYGSEFWGYLQRLSFILFWAYMLHVPFYSMERMLMGPWSDVVPWLQSDVLHVIVYTSIATLALYLFSPTQRIAERVAAVTSLAIMFGTVFIWNNANHLPLALSLPITAASPFPLVPWSAYLFAGYFFTGIFFRHEDKTALAKRMIIGGALTSSVMFALRALPVSTPWDGIWWITSPGMQLFRLGGVVMAMGGLFLVEQQLSHGRVGRFLQRMGQESLFMYVSHLLIVYGAGSMITSALFGFERTGLGGALLITVIVTIPLAAYAVWWNTFKKIMPHNAQRILAALVTIFVLVFLVQPASWSWTRFLGLTP